MGEKKRVYKRICDGRYSITKKLGGGGSGRVYRATDEVAGEEVALKMVAETGADPEKEMEELKRNYQRVGNLHHPNIVAVKDLLVIPEFRKYALKMEYVSGQNLLQYRRKQPGRKVPLERAVRFASEIASGLDFAHRKGVIHRDIKPENIIVTNDTEAKIADFGLAMRFETVVGASDKDLLECISGTYTYMAPEQRKGMPHMASDIYSLGAVVYEMISGHLPFESQDPLSLKECHESEWPPPLIQHFPGENDVFKKKALENIDAVIRKAMAKDKDDRYRTAGEFADALKEAYESSKTIPEPTPVPKPVLPLVLAGALLVVACAFLYFWLTSNPVGRLSAEDIVEEGSRGPAEMAVARLTLAFMDGLYDKDRKVLVAVDDTVEAGTNITCDKLGIPLRQMISTGIDKIDEKLGKKIFDREAITPGQLAPLRENTLQTITIEMMPHRDDVWTFMENGGTLIGSNWVDKGDRFVLQLNAYYFSKIPGKEAFQMLSAGSERGDIPKAGWTQSQLGCLGGGPVPRPSEPVPAGLGSLKVITAPVGATIFINDEKQSAKSPLTVPDLVEGPVRVRAEMEDFGTQSQTAEVREGRVEAVELKLKRLRTRLRVSARPENAEIKVLGAKDAYRDGMPLAMDGDYTLEVTAPGYIAYKEKIALKDMPENKFEVVLEKPTQGHVIESSTLPGMKFVFIPPGDFTMGSPESEGGGDDERPQHQVVFKEGFYMQTTEVTVGQWQAFIDDARYETEAEKGDGCWGMLNGNLGTHKELNWKSPGFSQENDHPVVCISWNDAKKFIEWLSGKDERKYALPSEAQWEYAARAQSTTAFANGGMTESGCGIDPNLDQMGWYCGNADDKTHPVADKKKNDWDLYDMHGNVYEWVEDDWHGDYKDAPSDGSAWVESPRSAVRVLRGGSWDFRAGNCRSANRFRFGPVVRGFLVGLRLAALF